MTNRTSNAVPQDFKYRETFLQERPRHQKTDPFRIRHPNMDVGRRAKIFAPFDALRGFSAALIAVESEKAAFFPEEGRT